MAEPPFVSCLSHFMDGRYRLQGTGIINKTVYLCVGLKQNGLKEVLAMCVSKSESSSFWIGTD